MRKKLIDCCLTLKPNYVIRCSLPKTNFGILKTNSFTVRGVDGANLLQLFPTIARLNHSCRPNCNHYWSASDGEYCVRASRAIASGEELTISYMSPLQRADFHETASRRKILQVTPRVVVHALGSSSYLCLSRMNLDSIASATRATATVRRRTPSGGASWRSSRPGSSWEKAPERPWRWERSSTDFAKVHP